MDTEGPVSVLDRRIRSTSRDRVIADRITRQRSPGSSSRHHRNNGVESQTGSVNDEDDQEELIYRISQPYRTSFSAKHSVTWGKVDRSRSLSPTSSLRSDLSYCSVPPTLKIGGSKRQTRGQSKSPKRVTYNTRVTVRHSDTEDSVFTELSSYEYDEDDFSPQPKVSPFSRSLISPKYNEFSQLSPVLDTRKETPQHPEIHHQVRDITNMSYSSATDQSFISHDSGIGYSAELKDLSDQITKMNWSPKWSHHTHVPTRQVPTPSDPYFKQSSSPTSSSAPSPPGILKTSQGSYDSYRDQHNTSVRSDYDSFSEDLNLGHSVQGSRSSQSWSEEAPDGLPKTNGLESPKEESYQPELKDDATSSSPGDTSQGDVSPGRDSPVESGRLTPSKRSVSLSITSFLKRVSPHFRRKRSKDRNKKSSSAESSAQSLTTTSDPDTDLDITAAAGDNNKSKRSGRFSRNKVRQSFLKLVGGSSSKNKKKKKTTTESTHYTIEPQDPEKQTSSEEMDDIANGYIHKSHDDVRTANGKSDVGFPNEQLTRPAEITKTSEQESPSTKAQNLHQFTSNSGLSLPTAADTDLSKGETTLMSSPTTETIRSSTATSRMEFFTESDINAILCPSIDSSFARSTYPDPGSKFESNTQARSTPPNTLDVVPARTKRLLQTSMMSSISGDESIGDCSLDINLTASEPSLLSQSGSSKQVVIPNSLVSSTEGPPPASEIDSTSLRRSTAHRREQFTQDSHAQQQAAFTSRSDPSSPVDPSHKPSYLKLSCAVSGYGKYSGYSMYKDVARRSPCSSQSSLRSNMSSPDTSMFAGHTSGEECLSESKSKHRSLGGQMSVYATSPVVAVNGHVPSYPTGDTKKDGEYFLKHTEFEEERMRSLCMRTEAYTRSHDLPDEVSGRIRAAIGKANLLIGQKFVQFRDLCQNHMQRSPDERETKWEDLQGYWDIVRIQIDHVDDMFAEIELMRENGWQEVLDMGSKYSSASSSPKSGTVSQSSTPAVTPSHTPGSKRRNLKQSRNNKDTPDSSPDETQKSRQNLKARDEARKKLLSEKRAAMKLAAAASGGEPAVEIFLQDPLGK